MLAMVFDRTSPVYGPGELLSGDIVITTSSQCRILDLTVNYCGISSVSFVVAKGEGKARTCEKVEETDTHLDVLHPLVRSYRGLVVEPGVHTYDFSLQLPDLLPSSYKSPYGHISYYVSVHLITSEDTSDIRKPYVIRAPVNINLFPSGQKPKWAEVTEKYGLISNKSLRLKASVSKTCFVPGDIIPVFVEAVNETNRDIRYLFCTLKQITHVLVQLQDNTVSRVTKQCLTTVAHKVTKGKQYYSWLCQLRSPTFLTPTIAASTIVFVTYSLQISATLKRVPIPPDIQIPIVFGARVPTSPHPRDTNFTRRVSSQHLPGVHSSIQRRNNLLSSVAKMIRQGENESSTATNLRRCVSGITQPRIIIANLPRRGSCQPTFSDASSMREDNNDSLAFGVGLQKIAVSNHLEDCFTNPTGRHICRDELNATNSPMVDNESLETQSTTTDDLVQDNFTDFDMENGESPTNFGCITSDYNDETPTTTDLGSHINGNNWFEESSCKFLRRGSSQLHVSQLLREDNEESLPTITRLRRKPIIVSNLRRGSFQPRSLTSDVPSRSSDSHSSTSNVRRKPITVSILRRGSCQPHFSRQDSDDSTNSSPDADNSQKRPFRRCSCQCQFSVTNLIRDDRSETPPTATNPRRRITVSTQPQFNFTPSPSHVSQLQAIASSLTQRLTSQLHAFLPSR